MFFGLNPLLVDYYNIATRLFFFFFLNKSMAETSQPKISLCHRETKVYCLESLGGISKSLVQPGYRTSCLAHSSSWINWTMSVYIRWLLSWFISVHLNALCFHALYLSCFGPYALTVSTDSPKLHTRPPPHVLLFNQATKCTVTPCKWEFKFFCCLVRLRHMGLLREDRSPQHTGWWKWNITGNFLCWKEHWPPTLCLPSMRVLSTIPTDWLSVLALDCAQLREKMTWSHRQNGSN